MRSTYSNGSLSIHLGDVLSALPEADKSSLIDTLSCEDAVIRHVTDQLLNGLTEQLSSGAEDYPARGVPVAALSAARRRIALAAGAVAAEEVARLQRALVAAEARIATLEEDERKRWLNSRGGLGD